MMESTTCEPEQATLPRVQSGIKNYTRTSSGYVEHGTITMFARQASPDVTTVDDKPLPADQQPSQLFALTAGHAVTVGKDCYVRFGADADQEELLGTCVYCSEADAEMDDEIVTVDVGVILIRSQMVDRVDEYLRKGDRKKTQVSVKDPEEGDEVLVFLLCKDVDPLHVRDVGESSTTHEDEILRSVFFLENQKPNIGSGIICGDSGGCVWQDEGADKAIIFGMVIGCETDTEDKDHKSQKCTSGSGRTRTSNKCRRTIQVGSGKDDNPQATATDPSNMGVAVPMSRVLRHLEEAFVKLDLCGIVQDGVGLPIMVDTTRDAGQPLTPAIPLSVLGQ